MNTASLTVLGPVENIPVSKSSEASTLIAMFERLARDPSVPMERIERVMDMLGQLRKEQAEEEFNEALAQAQREMTSIARDSFNPQTKSKYASYAAIDKAIRPIRTKYGIGVSFDEGDGAPADHIRVFAFVTKGRHQRTYHYDSPIITTGMAGKTMMTLTHARASAVTYAKRYLMGMIFDLSTGEDSDGNAPVSEAAVTFVTPEQVAELDALIKEVNANEANVCKACRVASLADMTESQFEKAKAKLETMRVPL